jgi:hypothetical protein
MLRSLLILLLITPCMTGVAQPLNFVSRGVGGGGALFSPSINPANSQELYISCDMSQLFRSTDFGETYKQVHFSNFSGGANSRVNFSNVTGLLYSISYIHDVATPVKSTDNGVTWSLLPGNPDNDESYYSLFADYDNPDRLILSDYGHLFFSSNGGSSFTQFHTASNSGSGIVVGGVFFDGTHIFIGTNDGLLESTNSGTTWAASTVTGIPGEQGIWSFTAAKQEGTTRFFCITGNKDDMYAGMPGSDYWDFFKGLYSYDLGVGSTWTQRQTGITTGTDFPMLIDMAQNNISTVYIAGSNTSGEPIVMKTTDAGAQWTDVFLTSANANIKTGWSGAGGDRGWGYGECPFGFEVAANNPDIVVFTDFGFCHKTADGGVSWAQAYLSKAYENPAAVNTPAKKSYAGNGLENTTSWQLHWNNANNLWACFSDIRGIRSTDAGVTWSFNYTGNAANSTYRVVQSAGGTLFAATSSIHDMYQSTRLADNLLDANDTDGKIIYSTDNGLTWLNLHTFNHPVFWIALDPNNADRAYASVIHYAAGVGSGGVYRCDNLSALGSSTWTKLTDPGGTEKHPASLNVLQDGTLVASYSGRRGQSGFTPSSGIFTYNPSGTTWVDVSHPGMRYWTKDVVIDPNDANQNTWYAGVFSGWGGAPNGLGGLYKTIDRGASWVKLTGSLLDRVTSCTFNPADADELYVTTEVQGLWVSKNINAATPTFSLVTAYPFRQPERVFFNPFDPNQMWVTSFGNGLKMGLMDNAALPVKLTTFVATPQESKILLKWETTEEKDFNRFEIERSNDPKKGFVKIGSISSAATQLHTYQYLDSTARGGQTYYYKLKMIDSDGSLAYSRVVHARIDAGDATIIFPNPATGAVTVSSKEFLQSVTVVNMFGMVVRTEVTRFESKNRITVEGLPAGLYLVRVSYNSGESEHKLVVR